VRSKEQFMPKNLNEYYFTAVDTKQEKLRICQTTGEFFYNEQCLSYGEQKKSLLESLNATIPHFNDKRTDEILMDILKNIDQIKPFLHHCLALRELYYVPFDSLIRSTKGLQIFFMCLRYPVLQNLPFTLDRIYDIPPVVQSKLNETNNIWDLIHLRSGAVKKLILNETLFTEMMFWGAWIKKPENIRNLLHRKPIKILDIMDRQTEELDTSLFSLYNGFTENFTKGMQFLFEMQPDETIWTRRFIKELNEIGIRETIHCINDIGTMYDQLVANQVSFLINKSTIVGIHDRLSSLLKKIKTENQMIPFSDIEKNWEEQIEDYNFALPKYTHELIDIGETLKICVGSYGFRALAKNCTIISIKKENKWHGCIEVYENRLLQVKMYRNNKPDGEIKKIVESWAKKHNLNPNCRDMAS
jgi:hypothetical protein